MIDDYSNNPIGPGHPEYHERIEELKQNVIRSENAPATGVFHLGVGEVATKERDVRCNNCDIYIGMIFVKFDLEHDGPIGRRFVLGSELESESIRLRVRNNNVVECPKCKNPINLYEER
jgi:hypothetical protein